jgi:hypothetical protein
MPEVPLEQAQEEIQHHAHGATEPWILGVALTAAILAALAAVTALLAEHHANEATITQIKASDQWGFFQAKGIKAGELRNKVFSWEALDKKVDPKDDAGLKKYKEEQKEIEGDKATLKRYAQEQEEIKEKAEELQAESSVHLKRHFPLACGVTMFQVAIAIAAISVLIRKKPFWFISIAFGVVGAGFLVVGLVSRYAA